MKQQRTRSGLAIGPKNSLWKFQLAMELARGVRAFLNCNNGENKDGEVDGDALSRVGQPIEVNRTDFNNRRAAAPAPALPHLTTQMQPRKPPNSPL